MGDDLSQIAFAIGNFIKQVAADDHAWSSHPNSLADDFPQLALSLFRQQARRVPALNAICRARELEPSAMQHWEEIPCLPAIAFRQAEVSSLPVAQQQRFFTSSGTTAQERSRHYHNTDSLALYDASAWPSFCRHVLALNDTTFARSNGREPINKASLVSLTPKIEDAPNSSLVHMLDAVARAAPWAEVTFAGCVDQTGLWQMDFEQLRNVLGAAIASTTPVVMTGTAFSFVHWADHCAQNGSRFALPPGSVIMETGGYKGRSREVSRSGLHDLINDLTRVPRTHIVCEYGMCELSSQAYDLRAGSAAATRGEEVGPRTFHFPPWARVRVVSPETGQLVSDGSAGIIQVFDLANVWSAMAIQTEDLGIRRGDGFELVGRCASYQPKGCSLFAATE
jgi:hypothetical protein